MITTKLGNNVVRIFKAKITKFKNSDNFIMKFKKKIKKEKRPLNQINT